MNLSLFHRKFVEFKSWCDRSLNQRFFNNVVRRCLPSMFSVDVFRSCFPSFLWYLSFFSIFVYISSLVMLLFLSDFHFLSVLLVDIDRQMRRHGFIN